MAKKYNFQKGDILLVIWHDANELEGWSTDEDIENLTGDAIVHTVGHYVKTSRNSLMVAASIGFEDCHSTGGLWTIPKKMIKTIEVIREQPRDNVQPKPSAETIHREPSEG